MNISKYTLPVFVLILLLSYGCSTSKKTAKEGKATSSTTKVEKESSKSSELQLLLNDQRSSLRDLYTTQQNDMPKVFLKKDSSKTSISDDPFEGYRIQLLSTRNVHHADSVADKFRSWADSTFSGYYPRVDVLFSQPFYKVHVGDFQDQNMAYRFSNQLKKKYPAAWVVHDRIKPNMVPADTVQFSPNINEF